MYYIFAGLEWTFILAGGGLGLGFAIGLPFAIGHKYGVRWIRRFVDAYTWVFRSTPLIVLLFFLYYAVFPGLNMKIPALVCSILALGLRSGAFQTEIFRASLKSVDEGQIHAALTIGMSKWRGVYHIIIPQIMRLSIPPWSNEYSGVLKNTTYCFALGILEVLNRTQYVSIGIQDAVTPFLFAGALFLVFTRLGTYAFGLLYERTKIPGMIGGK